MAAGAIGKFGVGAPMFEPEVFWKQMFCRLLKNVLVTLLDLFGAQRSDSAPPW